MQALFRSWDPAKRHLRHAAWLIALALAVASWQVPGGPAAMALRVCAALIFAAGTVLPRLFRWPALLLFAIAYPALWLLEWAGWSRLRENLVTALRRRVRPTRLAGRRRSRRVAAIS